MDESAAGSGSAGACDSRIERSLEDLRQQIGEHCKKLAHAMGDLGENTIEQESLGMLQQRSKAVIRQISDQAEFRRRLIGDLAKCENGNKSALAEKESVDRELTEWRLRWSHAVAGVVDESADRRWRSRFSSGSNPCFKIA